MWNGSPVPPPAGTTGNLWASLGLPPPASTSTTPVFTGFSVGSKKPPNRSAESKAKTAAKRSMTAKAVKVWEALKYHMDKGVHLSAVAAWYTRLEIRPAGTTEISYMLYSFFGRLTLMLSYLGKPALVKKV